MSKRPKHGTRKDANQAQIISDLYDAMPCLIDDVADESSTHDIEVWAYDIKRDLWRWTHWEIKTEAGDLTPAQRQRMADWPGSTLLARSADDVLREYGRIQ